MENVKPWWTSKAIIGGVIAVIAPIVDMSTVDSLELTDLVFNTVSMAGAFFAIYGRVVAKQVITTK